MPAIIIEGIDGAGKTTLIEKLKGLVPKKYDLVITHKSAPQYETAFDEYLSGISWLRGNHFFIADRFHVGEQIYGPIYRGKTIVGSGEFQEIEGRLAQLNAVKVVLLPELTEVIKRLALRGEDFLQPKDFIKVWDFYDGFLKQNPSWIRLTDNSDEVAQQLVDNAIGKK